ncbi:PREDICTED: protein phosphatase 1 regulatory subunit 42-like [Amphimedon queenslandica]|uniref:Protein phosphatase 1 regulatory subunit 42 n=1 Tax=Amphimedon queenslandica TaxID=400682 RepID=A0A1X7VI96_AMPQE|nr:PREDICTED: protein phosphatase 1 regulatory subunit 42-like [Amphimedon queenslandica]|eukprot:XP_003384368.2 PREDICTED: protein phosphatase 1 regulatory subunit 42-like [Amphimedon queenslandica]
MATCYHSNFVAKETSNSSATCCCRLWDEFFKMPRLTVDLLARCTGHATKRRKDETQEQFLAKVTHLYCSEKGLEMIENLHYCRNLSVLYLYDNQIETISGLHSCHHLTHLYLQHNSIFRMENLDKLNNLTKLYLSHNSIQLVEGLEQLSRLSELHISHQNLPEGEKLLFDPRSLKAIVNSLTILNVSGNRLASLEDIGLLVNLEQLMATDNDLTSMKDLGKVLSRFIKLWKLELNGNPLSYKQKYRDRVVTMCHRLESLDGRDVNEMERQFLFSWKAMRKARQQLTIKPGSKSHFEEIDSKSPRPPPTMPPLPARQPFRLHLLQQKRKRQLMGLIPAAQFEAATVAASEAPWQSAMNFHLPQIGSDRLVSLAGLNPQNELPRYDLLQNKGSKITTLPPLLF